MTEPTIENRLTRMAHTFEVQGFVVKLSFMVDGLEDGALRDARRRCLDAETKIRAALAFEASV